MVAFTRPDAQPEHIHHMADTVVGFFSRVPISQHLSYIIWNWFSNGAFTRRPKERYDRTSDLAERCLPPYTVCEQTSGLNHSERVLLRKSRDSLHFEDLVSIHFLAATIRTVPGYVPDENWCGVNLSTCNCTDIEHVLLIVRLKHDRLVKLEHDRLVSMEHDWWPVRFEHDWLVKLEHDRLVSMRIQVGL